MVGRVDDPLMTLVGASRMAVEAHNGMFRDDGKTPFVIHCFRVTQASNKVLRQVEKAAISPYTKEQVIAASILHDVLEDCDGKYHREIECLDPMVYQLCKQLRNPSCDHPRIEREDKARMNREHYNHVELAAVFVKFCDRADNLADTGCWKPKRKERYARESWQLLPVLARRVVTSEFSGVRALAKELQFNIIRGILSLEMSLGKDAFYDDAGQCSMCHQQVYRVKVPEYCTEHHGLVKDAVFAQCVHCNDQNVSRVEFARWQKEGVKYK